MGMRRSKNATIKKPSDKGRETKMLKAPFDIIRD
jgi:hypothetical protein